MLRLFKIMLFLFACFSSGQAMACGQGYYRDDFGVCWPNGDTVIQQVNPINQVGYAVQIVKGLATNDQNLLKHGIGGMILTSKCPVACETVATNILPELTPQDLKGLVGRGFIVFATTGDPFLTLIDTANETVRQVEVNRDRGISRLPSPPRPPRGAKRYQSSATCIGVHVATNKVTAAWVNPPALILEGVTYGFPGVDLRKNDLIELTAPFCPDLNNAESGYQSLTSALIAYDQSAIEPGDPEQFKYFISGVMTRGDGTRLLAGETFLLPPPPR